MIKIFIYISVRGREKQHFSRFLPLFKGEKLEIRRARIQDAYKIQEIIKKYSVESDLLKRSIADLYSQIRDYIVAVDGKKLAGVIAVHVYWEDLSEIRSFVLEKKYRGKGYGEMLLKKALEEAGTVGTKNVFALTKIPDFFKKNGFKIIPKNKLPHKIWKDCFACTKFPDCDETALIMNIFKKGAK